MKNKKNVIRLLLFFILILSITLSFNDCINPKINKQKKEISKLIGKKVLFPYSLNLYHKDSILQLNKAFLSSKKIKIVKHFDATCPTCIQELAIWEYEMMNKTDTNFVKYIFILHHENYNEFKRELSWRIPVNFPLIIDTVDIFLKKNNLHNKKYRTFALNEDNEIILLGNPLNHPNLKKLYFEIIENQQKN